MKLNTNRDKPLKNLFTPALPGLLVPLTFLLIAIPSCTNEVPEREVRSVTDAEAEAFSNQVLQEITPEIAEDLELTLWAHENLLGDPVDFSICHW